MSLAFADHLLPGNATPAEEALSASLNRDDVLGPGMDAIAGWRYERPLPAGFGPYLVDELQLGPVRQFFTSDEACVDAGWPWIKLRGTVQAAEDALAWIGYESTTVEAPNTARANWHRWQMEMGALPVDEAGVPVEDPRLVHAEYLASLSDPARALFWRGFEGYDVRALEWSGKRWGDAIWGDDSGVRLEGQATKWSHGRDHGPFEVTATTATLAALGLSSLAAGSVNWTSSLTWAQVAHLTWGEPTPEQIAELMVNVVAGLSKHVAFFDGQGALIGARRVYAAKPASTFAGQSVPTNQAVLEMQARTGFGDGFGSTAATAALIIGAHSTRGPGDLWITPEHLAAPDGVALADLTIGSVALPLTFARTIREHITIKVRLL